MKDAKGHGSDARGGSSNYQRGRQSGNTVSLGGGRFAVNGVQVGTDGMPAHQEGITNAMRAANSISPDFAKGEIADATKNDMNPYTARMALQATDSLNKDYHTLSSSQTSDLHDYAKQFGFRKSATSPGSLGLAFHGYLHKQLNK